MDEEDQEDSPLTGESRQNGFGELIAMLLALFKGESAPPEFTANFERLRDPGAKTYFAPNASAAQDLSGFSKIDNFPADVKIVRAEIMEQRNGSPMRIRYIGEHGEEIVKSRETTTAATRAWMNNDPGNLRYGEDGVLSADERARMTREGAIGVDGNGHGIFPSPEAGLRAMATRLRSGSYANMSLQDAIAQYAPSSDGNDPARYAANICAKTGIPANRRLCDMNNDELSRMVAAMVQEEGYSQKRGQIARRTVSVAGPDGQTASLGAPFRTATDGVPVVAGGKAPANAVPPPRVT